MFRYIIGLFVLIFVVGCKQQELFPPQCVVQEFDEEKYEGADYPVVRDAIYQINLDNYNCFEQTALEMLKTPEKQALYKPALIDKHAQILIEAHWQNKYLKGERAGRVGLGWVTSSRLNTQILVDKFLRQKPVELDKNKIPEECRKYLTAKERNGCYEQLFAQYIDEYIFDGYSPRFKKKINYKPEFTQVFKEGTGAIRELLERASDNQDYIEQYMELYYLDLIEHFFKILAVHE